MSMYHKTVLAAVLCGAFGIAAAKPVDGMGDSSNQNAVDFGTSDALPFGAGKAGLAFSNDNGKNWSNFINLENGPVKHIRNKYGNTPINGNNAAADVNGTHKARYLMLKDVSPVAGFFYNPTLGQVWYENRAHNTEVYSVRQMTEPKLPIAPKFGGLVIGKVPNLKDGNVFFGEWAPRAGNPPQNSTDLNMNDDKRTVWYVGDKPTQHMPTLVNVKYDVVGINKHTPGKNDFYTGTLTVNYGGKKGDITGTLTRGSDSIDFADTKINSKGYFNNDEASRNRISGQFYGHQAQALAGIVDRDGVANDVAFGGRKR